MLQSQDLLEIPENMEPCLRKMQDEELVARLINDDEKAFCELYARYRNRLIYFAVRFVKDPSRAEDIFQDTFALIWKSRHFLDPGKSFSGYVFTIVKNRVLNILRNIHYEEKLKRQILSRAIDCDEESGGRIVSGDIGAVISGALQALTPRQRQIFMMSRNERMSHKEIAEKLNLSIYTVQEHISLSIKKIKIYLSEHPRSFADILILLFLFQIQKLF